MNPIKALIIDDEPLAHQVILQYASDIPFLEIVAQCYLATTAYATLNQHQIDLIFLDINMPKIKGLDFLRTLNHPPQVIITSAYEEYAIESFELQVCDYLLKPFRFDRFLKAVNKAQTQISLLNQDKPQLITSKALSTNDLQSKELFIKSDKRIIQIQIKDIQYLESYGNYVKIWVQDSFHLTQRTLSSFEDTLNADFHRIHKSFIVHKKHINYVEGNRIIMQNEQELSIGKNYKQIVKNWLS